MAIHLVIQVNASDGCHFAIATSVAISSIRTVPSPGSVIWKWTPGTVFSLQNKALDTFISDLVNA